MSKPSRQVGVAIVAGAIGFLVVNLEAADAQQAESRFIVTKSHVINRNRIEHIRFAKVGPDGRTRADLYFSGNHDSLMLIGEEAEQLRAAFSTPKTEPIVQEKKDTDGLLLRAFDDFNGEFGLNWKPVRPDMSHVSLTKQPGKLTITTQRGSIHGEETKDEFGEGIKAKNLFLIDNPLAKDAELVITTCVSGFTPAMPYQQAGLIVYDDDDNYLKWGYEYNWPKEGGQAFCCVTETEGKPTHDYAESESGLKRYWLRLTKRGPRYEYASSVDGKTFRVQGEVAWGDGAPRKLGLLAKNGGNKEATELDAGFEFFELRASAAPRTSEIGSKY